MKKGFVFLFILGIWVFSASAQKRGQELIDSLLLKLPEANEDSNKVKLLYQLAYTYPYINPAEGVKCGKQALKLAEKLYWKRGIAMVNYAIGSNYATRSDYALALEFEYKALKIYEGMSDLHSQALMHRNIGIVYHNSKNQQKALEYDFKALQLYGLLNDKDGIAAVYTNIANVYYTLRDKEKVMESNMKALRIYESLHNEEGTARLFGNIANLYAEYGEYSKAMPFYFNALRKERALKNESGVTRNMGNIGETYLDIAKENSGKVIPDSLIPAGKDANLKLALTYLTTAIKNAKQLGQSEFILAFEEVLSEAYQLSGNTMDALKTYQNYILVRDSIYDVEKYNAATRRELDYEYGKREDSLAYQSKLTAIKLIEEKKIRSTETKYFSLGLLLVLIFSGFMYNRWRITQKQKGIIEVEKKRSESLLLNILPEEVADELKEKGTAEARQFDAVTVMFTDFKGFTQIAEKLSPTELVAEIHTCFKAFDEICSRNGIEKIKTIGDAYMCAGGLPIENKTHAEDVVRAAVEIQKFMLEHFTKRLHHNLPVFEIRIGIHSGTVVAGIVGVKKFAYDIWGDTVNLASRMESSGEPGKINISGSTYELIKDKFKCTYRGKIQAKNKGEVDMYFVNAGL